MAHASEIVGHAPLRDSEYNLILLSEAFNPAVVYFSEMKDEFCLATFSRVGKQWQAVIAEDRKARVPLAAFGAPAIER